MCRILSINPASYYTWLRRGLSKRDLINEKLLIKIKEIHADKKKKAYGSPKITHELKNMGFYYNHKRVARLMKENNIKAIIKKNHKYSGQGKPEKGKDIPKNILNRNFNPSKINKSWVTDITYIQTDSGWAYLCNYIDLFGKKVVGWATSSKPDTKLVLKAFKDALNKRNPPKGLLVHSDQGCQYTSKAYLTFLKESGFVASMSRRGNCWDNACAESFFGHLKNEYLFDKKFKNVDEVNFAIFDYIESFYNNKRLHSGNKLLTPNEFEKKSA